MQMGKLTAKLRDAVLVCLMVEDKEIKRYRNIEIPDEIKKLEYQGFKFDVPLNGAINFKIMFKPGVLPEEFPQTRERKTRKPLAQEEQPREAALAADMAAEVESNQEPQTQYEQAAEARPTSVVEAFIQGLENTQATGELVADIAAVMADGEAIKAESIEDGDEGGLFVITAEREGTAATDAMADDLEPTLEAVSAAGNAQPKDNKPNKKPTSKGKCKKGTASTEDASK